MRLYLSCGLTHVPRVDFDQYVSFIEALAAALLVGAIKDVRYALRDSDPKLADEPISDRARLCYTWDHAMVEWADLVVADATYPSIGVGIELQIAAARGTPIVLCYQRAERHRALGVRYKTPDGSRHDLQIGEGYVSLMALGLPSLNGVVAYDSADEALRRVPVAVQSAVEAIRATSQR